ncbi:MAG: AmmeMemoRadiSam system protein A [Pseudomonadota bacterium]
MDKRLRKVGVVVAGLAVLCFSFSVTAENVAKTEQRDKSLQKQSLTSDEKQYLLTLARKTLEQYLKGGAPTGVPGNLYPNLQEKRGCFVTLMEHGELRGCIGYIEPIKPLCDCVIENAINAAVRDTRFPALMSMEELGSISIEISVLTVPEKVVLQNPAEFLDHLVPGRDGVILKQGWHQATYLPQVWEHFPDKEDFLNSLCQKGGMPIGCWKDEGTEIYLYRAEVFHE